MWPALSLVTGVQWRHWAVLLRCTNARMAHAPEGASNGTNALPEGAQWYVCARPPCRPWPVICPRAQLVPTSRNSLTKLNDAPSAGTQVKGSLSKQYPGWVRLSHPANLWLPTVRARSTQHIPRLCEFAETQFARSPTHELASTLITAPNAPNATQIAGGIKVLQPLVDSKFWAPLWNKAHKARVQKAAMAHGSSAHPSAFYHVVSVHTTWPAFQNGIVFAY